MWTLLIVGAAGLFGAPLNVQIDFNNKDACAKAATALVEPARQTVGFCISKDTGEIVTHTSKDVKR